ncbi:hypothetical protein BGZ47_007216 [Haplosporangium gracile]|nr:hypothetical protein BGZ47_007216 [Haplosporangium gracile]
MDTNITDEPTSVIPSQQPPPLPADKQSDVVVVDIENVLSWLEHPANFTSVFGTSKKSSIGSPNKSSTQGYAVLAQVISKKSKGRLSLNAKAMRERSARHRKIYVATKESSRSMGFGVTEEDPGNGICTVAHKLESMCVCFARMNALFGHQLPEPSTAPRFRRRLVGEKEEDDEEEEDKDESEDDCEAAQVLEDCEGGETIDEYNQDNDAVDNIFDGTFDNTFDNIFDNDNDAVGDEISELFISTPLQQRQKRQLTDTESHVSNKRSRATDRRKTPLSLHTSFPELPKRSFLSSLEHTAKVNATGKSF